MDKIREDDGEEKTERKINGRRNLIILGLAAGIIALTTTSISLFVYHASGDIYLDRSRPNFLPDAVEAADDESAAETTYKFSDNGGLTEADLEKYLQELDKVAQKVDKLNEPYADAPLSDESLGITATENQETSETPEGE